MGTLMWPEKPSSPIPIPPTSSSHKRVIKELVHGRDLAIQLQTLLQRGSRTNGSNSAGEMAGQILRSFTESISALSSVDFGEAYDDGGSEDSSSSKKRPGSKDGRGCYKRRKDCETSTTVTSTVDDSYAWRKYGQKMILNARFPRCYFRCTHKHEQGCRATKQVQQMEDNPPMYQTTYIGQHTCRRTLKSPQIITESDPWESYSAISCESKPSQNNRENYNSIPYASVKEESKEDSSSDVTENFSPLDLAMFGQGLEAGSGSGSHHGFDTVDMDDLLINYVGFDAFGEAGAEFSYNNYL